MSFIHSIFILLLSSGFFNHTLSMEKLDEKRQKLACTEDEISRLKRHATKQNDNNQISQLCVIRNFYEIKKEADLLANSNNKSSDRILQLSEAIQDINKSESLLISQESAYLKQLQSTIAQWQVENQQLKKPIHFADAEYPEVVMKKQNKQIPNPIIQSKIAEYEASSFTALPQTDFTSLFDKFCSPKRQDAYTHLESLINQIKYKNKMNDALKRKQWELIGGLLFTIGFTYFNITYQNDLTASLLLNLLILYPTYGLYKEYRLAGDKKKQIDLEFEILSLLKNQPALVEPTDDIVCDQQ